MTGEIAADDDTEPLIRDEERDAAAPVEKKKKNKRKKNKNKDGDSDFESLDLV